MANTKKFYKTRKNSFKNKNKNKTNTKTKKNKLMKGGKLEDISNNIIANYILCKGYYVNNSFHNSIHNDELLMKYLQEINDDVKKIFKYLIKPDIHNNNKLYNNSKTINSIENRIIVDDILQQWKNISPPPRPAGAKPPQLLSQPQRPIGEKPPHLLSQPQRPTGAKPSIYN